VEVRTVPCEGPKGRGSSPSGGKEPLLSLLLSLFLLLSSLSPALSEEWYSLEEWEVGGEGSAGWCLLEGWEGGARTLGAPRLLSPSPSSFLRDNTPTLDWSDVEGAASYQLLVDNDPSFSSPEINTFPSSSEYTVPDPGLSDGTWYWKVRAKNGPLTSPWSEARSFTVDTVPPPAPSPLSPFSGENLQVDQPLFSWSSVWDPSGVSYRLEIDNDPDLSSPLYRREGIAENSHVPENKLVENLYYWRVTAVDGAGNENSSEVFLFRLRVPPSSRISTVVSPYWQTSSPLTLTVWAQDNDGTVENVELWYRYSPDNSSWGPWILYDNLTSLPYTFQFAFPEQGHYQFSSGVWDDRGNYRAPSVKEAEAGYDNTPPAIPLPSLPENGAVVQTPTPTLAWSGVEDVSGVTYELWLDNDDSDPPLYHLLTGENVHTLENCLGSGTYLWRVRALDGAGWVGEWSENYTFTVRLWGELESWQAEGALPARWSPLEGWEGTVVAPHVWVPLEGWSASPAAPPVGWRVMEGYSVFLSSLPSFWFPLQGYVLGLSSPASWRQAEALSSTTQAPASWREGEGWTGVLGVPSSLWRMAEGWQAGIYSLPSFWSPCDSWTSSSRAPVPAPRLLSPGEGENTSNRTPTLTWENLQPADNFELQVDDEPGFTEPLVLSATVASTSYTPTTPLSDNLYYWRVRQLRSGENGPWSQVRRFRVDTVRPAAPVLLWPANGENINDNTPLFRWCSVPENSLPVTYWIQIDNEPTLSEPYVFSFGWVGENQLQLPSENALPDGVYYWRVKSKDNAGNLSLSWSQTWSFRVDTVRPSVPVPQFPVNGAWAPITPTLTWQAVQENSLPVLYKVWVCEDDDFENSPWAHVYESSWVQENSWTAPELLEALGTEGKVFYWKVCARDNAGNLGENCPTQWFRVDNVAPSQVQLLYPENGSCVQEGSVTIRWYSATDGGSGVAGYWIQVYSGPSLLCENFVTENQHTLSLGAGEFLWRVRALDAVGNAGPWSENRSFRTAGWRSLEAWTWTAGSPPGWRELEFLTVSAASRVLWVVLEGWTGTLSSPASWRPLEGWAGNLAIEIRWLPMEAWATSLPSPSLWRVLESWALSSQARAGWRFLEGWQGLSPSGAVWSALEAWATSLPSPSLWRELESWSLSSPSPARWSTLEGWEGTVRVGAGWSPLETWTVIPAAPSSWHQQEAWSVSTQAGAFWRHLETWSVGSEAQALWLALDLRTGVLTFPALWGSLDSLAGVVRGPSSWVVLESLTGGLSARAGWTEAEVWSSTCRAPALWREADSWISGILSPARWRLWESWVAALPAPSRWLGLEGWTGTSGAPACWSLLEGWSGGLGTVEAGWRMLEARSSAAASPALWAPLDSRPHLLPAPGVWGVLEGGTFTSGAPVPAPLPLLPENALNTSDSTPTFAWENLQPADYFELQVDNDPGFSGPEVWVSVAENSYTPTTPLPDNLYRWRVRAWRSGVSSPWSEVRTFRVDTLPPARPSPLSPAAGENVGDSAPVLRWQAPPENSYPLRYYVEVSPDKVNIAESRWVEKENVELSFKEDGIWWWRVLARDNAGNQGPFTEWRKFRVDTLPPSPPPLLSPENDRWVQTSPVLSWGAVEENSLPLTYQLVILYYPSLMVRENLWTGSTSFTTLLDEGRYLWRVRVKDNAGNLGPWSEERLFGVDNTPPSPAQPLRPENGSFLNLGPVQLSWLPSTDSPSGVRGYHLQVGENQDLSSLLYENENVGDNGYTWVLPGPGIYGWRVRALDLAGNASEWSGIRWFRACRWERLEGWSWEGRAPSGWVEVEGWLEGLSSPSGWRGLEGWGGRTEAPSAGWSRLEGWAGGVEALTGRWVELEGWRDFLPSVVVAPRLLYPENGRNLRGNAPTLSWENVFLADNYRLQLSSQAPVWAGENAYVGQEPPTLSDGSPRRGEVVGGSLEDTRAEDGVCENLAENEEDNTLNWEHRIENVPQAQTYALRVRGYTSGDENVGVYLWEMGAWRLLGWLGGSEATLEFSFGFRELGKYLVENRLAVRYLENTPDSTRTVLHLDLCVLEALSQEFPPTLVEEVLTENHYTPSPLSDNLYYWRVRAHVSGLTGEWSEIRSFRVDTVPPGAPTLLYPSDGENENTSTPVLGWLSPPENSLPLAFFVQVARDHLFTQPVENSGWIQQNYWVPSPLQEGVYYWRVFARDNAGNEGLLPSPTWSFRVDLTPPPVPVLLSPADGENLNTRTPLLRWENVWDISGPLSYNLRVEYGPVTVYDVTLSENAWQVPPLPVDGIYSWRVRARDGAGNWSPFSPSRTFQLDTAPPPAPSPLSPENGENLREVEFRWTPVAENSLPVRYRVKLSDDPSFSHENAVSGWVEGENWRMDLPLPDGIWYWRVQARDNAGNEGENSEIRWFRLDTLPPQGVDLLWPENGATLENSQPTLSWTEGTDNSLPLSYRVLVSVGEVESYLDSGWIPENSWQVPFPLPDNDYRWRVRARDSAGNVYETPVGWFRVENAPPPAPVPLSPENGKVVGIPSPLLVWRTSPDISQPVLHRVWVSRDENFESVVADSGWLDNDRWEVSPPLEDNLTYYWRVQARDNSGKESENSVTFRFFTDLRAPPEVELLSPGNGAELETFTLMFKWRSVEDNTLILYELAVDDEPSMTEPLLHAENTHENSGIVGFTSPGTYYWRVRAVDEAGHENSSPVWSFTLRRWRYLEGWSGGVSGPKERGWVVLDGRSGSSFTSASWVRLEERTAAVAGGVGWRVLEERRATAGHFSSWRALEGRSFSMRAPALRGWVQLENRSGGVVAPHGWRELEGMEVGALTSAGWKKVVVGGPALLPEWGPLEGWRAGVSGWAPPPSREVSLGYLEPGVPGSAEVGWLGICVSRLEVVVREEGRVTVSAWESEDFPVPPPPEVVPYRYFCLELGPSSPALSHAVVRVRVSRSWVREERIDVRTIGVRRLPSQELALEEVGRDGQYLYFQFRTEELGTFLLFGQRVRQPPSPPVALLPTFEVPAAPSSLLLLLLFLGMILAAAGFSLYQASWSFRYGRMVGLLRRATGPERRRAVRERVRLTRRQRESLARMSLLLRRAALPPVVPVRRRLAKPERVAVEALERFIRERRRAAGLAPEEVERLRRRARKELASWRTLQRVVERKRREVLRRRRVRGSSGARRGRRRAS
jgi:hypothetical protein